MELDYCNSLLYGAPAYTLSKLQRVQDQLARIVAMTSWRSNVKPVREALHWLPITERIKFKLAVITCSVRIHSSPVYLASLLQPYQSGRELRSSVAPRLYMPRTRTELGKRAFAVSAPHVWNSLPDFIRLSDSLSTFKRRLKTFFV